MFTVVHMKKKVLIEYLKKLQENKYNDYALFEDMVANFRAEAEKDKDELALGYADYFSAHLRYRKNKADDETVRLLINAVQTAESLNAPRLEADSHNLLGIVMLTSVDEASALEHYEKALDISRRNKLIRHRIVISNNIGDIYLRLGDYDSAITYFREAYRYAMEAKDIPADKAPDIIQGAFLFRTINVILMNIAEVHYHKEEYDEAFRVLTCVEDDHTDNSYTTGLAALTAVISIRLGSVDEAMDKILSVIESAESHNEMFENDDRYIDLTRVLIDVGNQPLSLRLLNEVQFMAKQADSAYSWCEYYRLKVLYEKKFNPGADLTSVYEEYFDFREKEEKSLKQQKVQAVNNKRMLEEEIKRRSEMEEKNKRLKKKSEHDPLTGLFNRYAMDSIASKWFDEARRKKQNFGVLILDVDNFKEYNDNYGHLKGDDILKEVARSISESTMQSEAVIRYGGDEFFVIAKNHSDHDIIKIAENIRDALDRKNIKHEFSKVSDHITVTEGAINGQVKEGQNLFDYIHYADGALYKIKNVQKNALGFYTEAGDDYEFKTYFEGNKKNGE